MHLLKKSLLTFALASAHVFTPAQAATYVDLGNITPDYQEPLWGAVFGGHPAKGNFDVIYRFSITNVYPESGITASVISSGAYYPGFGDIFTAITLTDSVGTILELGAVGIDSLGHSIASLPEFYSIRPYSNYQLELQGISSGNAANYAGSISIPTIPETEAWTMLLLGLPMLSLATRRRQGYREH